MGPQPLPPSVWAMPDASTWEPGSDVIATGADLEPSTLIGAYRSGLFPMHVDDGVLAWWSPDPRGIVPLERLRVPRSLAKSARQYRVSVDAAFDEVVAGCADPSRPSGWITDGIRAAYGELHRLGWAHSVEVWDRNGALVGGLYGVEVGGLFAGESMFHRARDASKVALVSLVERLRAGGGTRLLDVQWCTPHLASLGAVAIPRSRYLELLSAARDLPPCLA